jgi:hypothetical protein
MMEENEYFKEAREYYKNANEILKDIPVEFGKYYKSKKSVQKAAAVCYLALDSAIKGFLVKKGVDKKKLPERWDGLKFLLFQKHISDGKFRNELEDAYRMVHINIYYKGITRVAWVKEGFDNIKKVIERLSK